MSFLEEFFSEFQEAFQKLFAQKFKKEFSVNFLRNVGVIFEEIPKEISEAISIKIFVNISEGIFGKILGELETSKEIPTTPGHFFPEKFRDKNFNGIYGKNPRAIFGKKFWRNFLLLTLKKKKSEKLLNYFDSKFV